MDKIKQLLELENEYVEMFDDVLLPFPEYWYGYTNNKEKIRILKKAIKEKKLIRDISSDFVEGVFLK